MKDTSTKILLLTISNNPKEATRLTQFFTDKHWQTVRVEYGDCNKLTLKDGSVLLSNKQILLYLNKATKTSIFKNFLQAIWRILVQIKSNKPLIVDKSVLKYRQSICNKCPFQIKSLTYTKCSICGCFIKAKTKLITEACPKNFW